MTWEKVLQITALRELPTGENGVQLLCGGIGLTETVNGHTQFLHDGRARNLLEAILWHGGEAELIKQNFLNLNSKERGELLAFLNSL